MQHRGQTLFSRQREGAVLTPQGHALVRHAQAAVQAWEQAKQQLALPDQLASMLSIGVQTDLWSSVFLPWLERMKAENPELGVVVRCDYSEGLLEDLHEGRLDFALSYKASRLPGFTSQVLLRDQLILVSDHPRPAQIDWREDYVFVDWGAAFRAQHQAAYPSLRAPALTVGSYTLALDYLRRHGGSAFLPKRVVRGELDSGRLHHIGGSPVFNHETYLVRAADPSNPAVHYMIGLIAEDFAETLRGG